MSNNVTFDYVKECPICGHLNTINLEVDKFVRWVKERELIQIVWPEKTPAEREIIKTGIHQSCWDNLFKEE